MIVDRSVLGFHQARARAASSARSSSFRTVRSSRICRSTSTRRCAIPYFGNKAVLDWEASRELQREWLTRAGLNVPRQFRTGAEIDRPVIVKLYGAQAARATCSCATRTISRSAPACSRGRTTSSKSTSSASRSTSTISIRR